MIQTNSAIQNYSRFNVLAQPTFPMAMSNQELDRLAQLSNQSQWILFTSECPRPDYEQFASHQVRCQQIIQMKPSQKKSEMEIVIQAIKCGNASAVVASSQIEPINQQLLKELAAKHQCEVFFVEGRASKYH
ncbi:SulA-like leucine-rich domain-containing protein [Vibrio sonorensis]|uniref:SulA-like leucine-rich domain-containing protein n=1 Tax=Vibrio sonorensis TaxID=1004316 RepID=UPI0008DB2D4C